MGRKTKLTPKLQKDLCKLLAKGATDAVACAAVNIAPASLYNWLARGEKEEEGEFFAFLEAVTGARAKAHIVASNAFYSGLVASTIKEKITESFSETRIGRDGKPYEYKRETTRSLLRTLPPDWRAGEAWLKRRGRDDWSEKVTHEIEDWRSQAIADIKAGNIDFEALAEAFDESLAADLFRAAGVPVQIGEGPAQ